MTGGQILFNPLVPLPVLWGALALLVAVLALALWRGLPGWGLRALAGGLVLAALANPALQRETRTPLADIVLLIVDESASQGLSDRPDQSAAALARLSARLEALENVDLRILRLGDAPDNRGTLLMTALAQALAEDPRARIAGAILITDGQAHDMALAPDMPAPLHVLLTGRATDWDRRLIVKDAPAFAILGEELRLTLRIEDQGAVPAGAGGSTDLAVSIDGGPVRVFPVPVGRDIELPLVLDHAGLNVLHFEIAPSAGELTDRNNAAVVQINGVRDRLRVLLVSGEPHAGERTWRNLLKSDASVDLVHFTILRPPEKQDGIPVSELALIAFPTRELFVEKIGEFDLIIFDRYRQRGILPPDYLENVRDFIENGGAVLVAGGPETAGADSLFHSPLGVVLPARPTGRVIERGYHPALTALGARHPVTAGLADDGETPGWGRWFRMIELEGARGDALMSGPDGRPLLLLDRVGEGRVALLASDHIWLWGRGYEGGGPQLELLRRLAHWMMKEPELEEEALEVTAEGLAMTVTRRTLAEGPRELAITAPDGTRTVLALEERAPGRFMADWQAPEPGVYRLGDGTLEAVAVLGPAASREFEETIASGGKLAPAVAATRGGILRLEDGLPELRLVPEGRQAAGRGWIGLTPRGAYGVADIQVAALLPGWLVLVLAAGLMILAWLREGRRG